MEKTLDLITKQAFYNITSIEEVMWFKNEIDPDNFLVGLYNNETRFLTKDATLVKFASNDALSVHSLLHNNINQNNSIIFDLGKSHAWIMFKCAGCDEGKANEGHYDFINQAKRWDVNNVLSIPLIPLEFYLSDKQASDVFKALSNFVNDDSYNDNPQKVSYKYIPYARDCVGFLRDVWEASGFKNSFTSYYTDSELLNGKGDIDTKFLAFNHQHYHFAACEDSDKKYVSQYVASIYGADFKSKWKEISDEKVNISSIVSNSFIFYRIDEIKNTYIKAVHSICGINLSNNQINKIIYHVLDYNSLYYMSHTLNYQMDLSSYYKKLDYYPSIADKVVDCADFIEKYNNEFQSNLVGESSVI